MTEKKYMFCRLAIIIILSASISISLTLENYLLPIMFILTAMAAMYQCKKEFSKGHVTSDERDYKVAGDAARYAIYAYSWIGTVGTFVLMAVSHKEGILYSLSQFLAFSVCALMLANAFLFKYLYRRGEKYEN